MDVSSGAPARRGPREFMLEPWVLDAAAPLALAADGRRRDVGAVPGTLVVADRGGSGVAAVGGSAGTARAVGVLVGHGGAVPLLARVLGRVAERRVAVLGDDRHVAAGNAAAGVGVGGRALAFAPLALRVDHEQGDPGDEDQHQHGAGNYVAHLHGLPSRVHLAAT